MTLAYKGQGSIPEVKIVRLQKRINKLTLQRDHWKAKHDHYKAVVEALPGLEHKYNKYMELLAERKRVRDLEQRVQEQAILIIKLTQETTMKDAR